MVQKTRHVRTMYGVVNRAIEDFVVSQGGDVAWLAIRRHAACDPPTFLSMKRYPEELTSRLLASSAVYFQQSQDRWLHSFGRHFITFVVREGFGPLLRMNGPTFPSCLGQIDNMMTRIASTMPDATPPIFRVRDDETRPGVLYFVEYSSFRRGFVPVVAGMLKQLATFYQTDVEVTIQSQRLRPDDYDVFRVEILACHDDSHVGRAECTA